REGVRHRVRRAGVASVGNQTAARWRIAALMMGTRKRNRRKTAGWGFDLAGLLQPLATWVTDDGGLRPLLGVVALLVGVGVMVWGLVVSFDRPIGKVEVGGQFQRVAVLQIEEVVAPFRGSGFLSIDLDSLRAALETIPWVDRARVERKWPNSVRV